MYHGQEGPNPTPGNPFPAHFTWVDLVFPVFLFAMGAAFPFALSRRLGLGESMGRILVGVFLRYALLVAFAIYLQNTIPYVMGGSRVDHVVGFAAFLLLFPILTRFPKSWNSRFVLALRVAGVAGAVALLWLNDVTGNLEFDLHRGDPIILVLANMALVGSVLWLLGRRNRAAKLATLTVGLAIGLLGHASMGGENHVTFGLADALAPLNDGWWFNWAWRLLFLKYLIVVVPGMIVGDLLFAWMRSREVESMTRWSTARLWGLVGVLSVAVVFAHMGLFARWSIATPIVLTLLCVLALMLARDPKSSTERLIAHCLRWGALCLAVGLIFEPFEGGIKKTPSTMSHYLISAGLSMLLLVALLIVIDVFGHRRWGLGLMISNGQNPMLAYAGIRGLLGPFYALTGIDSLITTPVFALSAWLGAAWGFLKSLSLAWVVGLFTRWKILWRT
jgi:predicted acyltransferase